MANKGLTFPAEPLSGSEVRALLDECDKGTLTGARNYALLVVLWRVGLRCAEALALRPSDIDFGSGTVRVLRGKGSKARTVGIDNHALDVVKDWLAVREAAGIEGPVLFCTVQPGRSGHSLAPRYVRAVVARLGASAGIEHRCHPHGLRHTMAVELRKEGWSVPLISRQLGHSSIATTNTYLDHIYPAEVIDLARERSWS